MRVLQLIDSLNPGGAERVAVSYANALSERQDGSYLCATRAEGDLKSQLNKKVGYLFLEKRSAYDIAAISRLIRFCKENKILVIHAHTSSYFTATLIKFFLKDVILIWHDHYGKSEQLKDRPKSILKWCSKYFDTILAVNEMLQEWAKMELRAKRVIYFKNAVPILDRDLITARTLPGTDGQRVLLMANFRQQKDHFNALKAIAILRKTIPGVSLHLLGMHWNDAYYQSVLGLIEELELKEIVHLHGSHQDVNGFIKACDIGLLSSSSEGLPMAILEYAAMLLPVVCTRVGQCETVIQDNGSLVPSNDPAQLAQSLEAVLSDLPKANDKAVKLLERVRSEYSMQTIIPKLLNIYASID